MQILAHRVACVCVLLREISCVFRRNEMFEWMCATVCISQMLSHTHVFSYFERYAAPRDKCMRANVYRLLARSHFYSLSLSLRLSNSSLPVRVSVSCHVVSICIPWVCVCVWFRCCLCCSTLDCKSHANAAVRMLADNLNSIGNLRMYIIEIAYVFSAMYKYDVRGGVDFI